MIAAACPRMLSIHTPVSFFLFNSCTWLRPALAAIWGALYHYQTKAIILYHFLDLLQRNCKSIFPGLYFFHPHPGWSYVSRMRHGHGECRMYASFPLWYIFKVEIKIWTQRLNMMCCTHNHAIRQHTVHAWLVENKRHYDMMWRVSQQAENHFISLSLKIWYEY